MTISRTSHSAATRTRPVSDPDVGGPSAGGCTDKRCQIPLSGKHDLARGLNGVGLDPRRRAGRAAVGDRLIEDLTRKMVPYDGTRRATRHDL